MKQVLEGGKTLGEIPPEFYEYRLARQFGWTKAQIDEAPGHWTDWMLAIADTENGVRRG